MTTFREYLHARLHPPKPATGQLDLMGAPSPAPLAPLPVRARDSDPQPSHDAATLTERHGTATAQGAAIVALLARHPEGLTGAAIDAILFPHDRNVVACKRLPELERRGLVARTGERRATPSGVMATIWRGTSE